MSKTHPVALQKLKLSVSSQSKCITVLGTDIIDEPIKLQEFINKQTS